MELKSMKMTPAESKASMPEVAMPSAPQYPWGLQIELNDEILQKLEMDKLPKTETQVKIVAVAFVRSTTVDDNAEVGKKKRMALQITDLAVEPLKGQKATKDVLYGKE